MHILKTLINSILQLNGNSQSWRNLYHDLKVNITFFWHAMPIIVSSVCIGKIKKGNMLKPTFCCRHLYYLNYLRRTDVVKANIRYYYSDHGCTYHGSLILLLDRDIISLWSPWWWCRWWRRGWGLSPRRRCREWAARSHQGPPRDLHTTGR